MVANCNKKDCSEIAEPQKMEVLQWKPFNKSKDKPLFSIFEKIVSKADIQHKCINILAQMDWCTLVGCER